MITFSFAFSGVVPNGQSEIKSGLTHRTKLDHNLPGSVKSHLIDHVLCPMLSGCNDGHEKSEEKTSRGVS